jgi:Zn-finger in ubiquitin-hydrolases and other protein
MGADGRGTVSEDDAGAEGVSRLEGAHRHVRQRRCSAPTAPVYVLPARPGYPGMRPGCHGRDEPLGSGDCLTSWGPEPKGTHRVDRERALGMTACDHLDQVRITALPDTVAGCEECLRTGDRWVHLRMCHTCGHIGCCDSSPNRHATAHHRMTGHALMRSAEPGEDWSYCYIDDVALVLDQRSEARSTG